MPQKVTEKQPKPSKKPWLPQILRKPRAKWLKWALIVLALLLAYAVWLRLTGGA